MTTIVLKPGREKSLLRRHPWIFSGAVQHVDENIAPGASVDVLSSQGDFLARGAYSPQSQIRVRVWTFEDQAVDADFFRRRIADKQRRGRNIKVFCDGMHGSGQHGFFSRQRIQRVFADGRIKQQLLNGAALFSTEFFYLFQ